MSARYVYWIRPNGHLDKEGKYAPHALLSRWREVTSVDAEGRLSSQGADWEKLETALQLQIRIISPEGEEIIQTDARGIIVSALRHCAKTGPNKNTIAPAEFLRVANAKAAEFFRLPHTEYFVVSSISTQSLPCVVINYLGCKIEPIQDRRGFPFPDGVQNSGLEKIWASTRYQWTKTLTSGRSEAEAADRGIRALSLLRALWTFSSSYGRWNMHWGDKRRPMASILPGAVHTLHAGDGSAKKNYWIESEYHSDAALYKPSRGWDELEKTRASIDRLLSAHPARVEIEQLFLRYISALDHSNYDLSLLELWSLLEQITGTAGSDYDGLVEKASWIAVREAEYRELLNAVRIQRNRYVHGARLNDQSQESVNLIKSLVEPHLKILLENSFEVSSLAEYAELLALPRNPITIKKRLSQLELAKEIHCRVRLLPSGDSRDSAQL